MDAKAADLENKEGDNSALGKTYSDGVSKLSKRQQKKMAKRQKWLEHKPMIRAKEKAKLKAKRKEAREKGLVLGPSRKQLKLTKMTDSPCKLRIAFDMSLDQLMTEAHETGQQFPKTEVKTAQIFPRNLLERDSSVDSTNSTIAVSFGRFLGSELAKCLKQLHRCYSINRRAHAPLQLYITSFSGPIHKKMSATSGCLKWDLHYREEAYTEVFQKNEIVYLTSDSPNVVEQLDCDKAYIIGGLVDHNRCKGICYEKAMEAEVQHARLPIDEYLVMKTRKVLTVDQVFLIILRASEGKTWSEAFLDVIPKRKNIELIENPNAIACSAPGDELNNEDEVTTPHEVLSNDEDYETK